MEVIPDIRIDKKDWLESSFAICQDELPLTRKPVLKYDDLPFDLKDKLLQVYVTQHETVQVLGSYESFFLIRKRDGVIGWIQKEYIALDPSLRNFPPLFSKNQNPIEFFNDWSGVPYRWGGVSKSGIDCSSFTQAYFFDVLGTEIPKNSQDQRKLGMTVNINEIQGNDLIFCHRKNKPDVNHVGLFYQGKVHHAQLHRGVICDELEDFVEKYNILEIKRISVTRTKF